MKARKNLTIARVATKSCSSAFDLDFAFVVNQQARSVLIPGHTYLAEGFVLDFQPCVAVCEGRWCPNSRCIIGSLLHVPTMPSPSRLTTTS